jgi:hypothetical protein
MEAADQPTHGGSAHILPCCGSHRRHVAVDGAYLPTTSSLEARPVQPLLPYLSGRALSHRAVPALRASSAVHGSRTHRAIVRGTARCQDRSASASPSFSIATLGLAGSGGIAFPRFLRVSRASDHGPVAARRLSRPAQARVGAWLPTGSAPETTLHGARRWISIWISIQ